MLNYLVGFLERCHTLQVEGSTFCQSSQRLLQKNNLDLRKHKTLTEFLIYIATYFFWSLSTMLLFYSYFLKRVLLQIAIATLNTMYSFGRRKLKTLNSMDFLFLTLILTNLSLLHGIWS